MNPHSIVRTLAAVALVAVPSLASAQNYPYPPPPYNSCPDGQWINGQCIPNRDIDWQRRERERHELEATVSGFAPYNLYLNDGVHVLLHNGTVINPTGITLARGMRVHVFGNRNPDGSFRANQIDVVGDRYGYRPR